ncbi:hypothetical protein ACLOJK_018661 [Asimina triloba]
MVRSVPTPRSPKPKDPNPKKREREQQGTSLRTRRTLAESGAPYGGKEITLGFLPSTLPKPPRPAMDFFTSAFAANPPPSVQESRPETKSEPSDHVPSLNSPPGSDAAAGWSFGGLIKTLAASSESVISTYRRDLEEFRSGLQKETAVFLDAIKDLPVSLEAGASAAQDSIGSIDGLGASVWHGTAEIISQGKDAFLVSNQESDCSWDAHNATSSFSNPIRYSRFEAEVAAIQSDLRTFCEDPDDLDDFRRCRSSGRVLEERKQEIEDLIGENGVLEGVYTRLVPGTVEHETFWSRYFYRVLKLKQAEEARADLVKRAISGEGNRELSWDVEGDDIEIQDNVGSETKNAESEKTEKKSSFSELAIKSSDLAAGGVEAESDKSNVKMEGDAEKSEEKNEDHGQSSKDDAEEGLGWDEIEDIEGNDEKSMGSGFNSSGVDVRKRLSAVEAEEDLSWDIEEDDDEPVKK